MKILKSILLLLVILSASFVSNAQKFNKQDLVLKPGEYLFNSVDLYFFDDGINCYLFQKCRDIDTVFENKAKTIKVTADSIIKFQAYLFTDTFEYVYAKINKVEGWVRVSIPIMDSKKNFLKSFLKSPNYELYSSYVEIVPFKNNTDIFISNTDNWYIANLNNFKTTKIGTKGGRLEACQMIYPKNCVKCYIDLGWGENVWYDHNGRKTNKK